MRKLILILWAATVFVGVLSVATFGQPQAHGLYASLSHKV